MELDEMNLSELVLLAQDEEPSAHRGLGREALISIAEGEEVTLPVREVDRVRLYIMEFILDHWTQVKPLLDCPAQTKAPRACFSCTDIQVAECALENKKLFFGKE